MFEPKFVPERVSRARKGQGLTQVQLAEKAKLNVTTLRLLEKGKKEPMVGTLCALSKALLVPLSRFFTY